MSPDVITLRVPDSLGDGVRDVEALYALADGGRPAKGFILDMGGVGFMKPYGVVALLVTTRRLSALSGRRVELTEEWAELELLPEWPEQVEYERIRPAVVFGGAVAKRSRQIKTPETTLRRWIANFETEGIRGLFESERAEGKSPLDPETRGFILNLKAEYFPMRDNEIATICYVRFGKRPHGRTVRRVLEANPTAMRMFRRFKPNNEIEDLVERKLAIVTLHSEGWNTKSIAGYLNTGRPTVYRTLRNWIAEDLRGLQDNPRGGKRKVDLRAMNEVRRLQENPERGEFRVSAALARMGIHLSPRT